MQRAVLLRLRRLSRLKEERKSKAGGTLHHSLDSALSPPSRLRAPLRIPSEALIAIAAEPLGGKESLRWSAPAGERGVYCLGH